MAKEMMPSATKVPPSSHFLLSIGSLKNFRVAGCNPKFNCLPVTLKKAKAIAAIATTNVPVEGALVVKATPVRLPVPRPPKTSPKPKPSP
jgi:hypothetical protein